jgi:hypothetical protein
MARLDLRKRASSGKNVVDILIDGRPLRDFVREAESESATKEGHADLAGKYGGLPWGIIATDLLLGRADGVWAVLEASQGPHRVPLLLCECGEPGCWPLMATIEMADDRVTWRDFRQPHREGWDYSKLGPFSFNRAQYLGALQEGRSPALC